MALAKVYGEQCRKLLLFRQSWADTLLDEEHLKEIRSDYGCSQIRYLNTLVGKILFTRVELVKYENLNNLISSVQIDGEKSGLKATTPPGFDGIHALEVPLVLPTKATWTAANLEHTVSIISL